MRSGTFWLILHCFQCEKWQNLKICNFALDVVNYFKITESSRKLFVINCLNFEIRIKSSDFDGLKGTTESPFVYSVFPSHDVYMEVPICAWLILSNLGARPVVYVLQAGV